MRDSDSTLWFVLFSREGRIDREQFWVYGFLALAGLHVALAAAAFVARIFVGILADVLIGLPWMALIALTPYIMAVVCAKRTRDMGRSGWWGLLSLIPIVGIVYWLYIGIAKGKPSSA